MRVVFLGTPEFAVPSLDSLLRSKYEVCAVFTQPDKPSGRGQKLLPPPAKLVAQKAGVTVHQPERIRDENLQVLFRSLRPDFIVVVAYGQILPSWLLKSARIAPINVHGSLLPKYRGAAPVIWALLNGESTTGITTMLMDEHLDTGAILLQESASVDEIVTGGELSKRLAQLGAEMLIPTLDGVSSGIIRPVAQDSAQASWAPRIRKEQALLDWSRRAIELHNQIRAFNPWPLAYSQAGEERIQISRSRVEASRESSALQPGSYMGKTEDGLGILCGDRSVLVLQELKPANRRSMSGHEFAAGLRLLPGTLLFPALPPQLGIRL